MPNERIIVQASITKEDMVNSVKRNLTRDIIFKRNLLDSTAATYERLAMALELSMSIGPIDSVVDDEMRRFIARGIDDHSDRILYLLHHPETVQEGLRSGMNEARKQIIRTKLAISTAMANLARIENTDYSSQLGG